MKQTTVLIAVVGTSPAVITETVWALAHETPAVLPDKIVVLTTRTGKEKLVEAIRAPVENGATVWETLVATLEEEAPGSTGGKLAFGATSVLVCPDARCNEAADLRSVEDNERMADFVLEELRKFTENPACRVIASIAGGRKTMSALMFSCMSLLGRDCDRVTHVLVNPPFDTCLEPPFYFPREGVVHRAARDPRGEGHPSSGARIELFDVPFVRMRGWYQERFKNLPPSYSLLVSKVRTLAPRAEAYPRLVLRLRDRIVLLDGKEVPVSPAGFAALLFLTRGIHLTNDLLEGLCALKKQKGHGLARIDWLMSFQESERFKLAPGDKMTRGDLTRVLSELRKAFGKRLPSADALVPKHGAPVTYPAGRISWKDGKWLTDICGYLFESGNGPGVVR